MPITTLLVCHKHVRTHIGLVLDKKNLKATFTSNESKQKFYYIIDLLLKKEIKVSDIYTKKDRESFINNYLLIEPKPWNDIVIHFTEMEYPIDINNSLPQGEDFEIKQDDSSDSDDKFTVEIKEEQGEQSYSNNPLNSNEEIDPIPAKDDQEYQEDDDNTGRKNSKNIYTYKKLMSVFKLNQYYKDSPKLKKLLNELKLFDLDDFQFSSSFVIRSLLENYVHEYIDYHLDQENLKVKGVAKDRKSRKELKLLLTQVRIHLNDNYVTKSEILNLIDFVTSSNNQVAVTEMLNSYIHSGLNLPSKSEVIDIWLKVGPIIQELDIVISNNRARIKHD